jgi:hypothetical protein
MVNNSASSPDFLSLLERTIVKGHLDYFSMYPERTLSFPVPFVHAEQKYLSCFVYNASLVANLETLITFPMAMVYADYPNMTEVSLEELPDDWNELSENFPITYKPGKRDPYVQRSKRQMLSSLYPAVLDFFPDKDVTPLTSRFLQLFNEFTPLTMIPLYHRMNPDFWYWLAGKK